MDGGYERVVVGSVPTVLHGRGRWPAAGLHGHRRDARGSLRARCQAQPPRAPVRARRLPGPSLLRGRACRRWSSTRRRMSSGLVSGVSLSACSASSAAVAGAPRECAARAASSRIDAISSLGSAVASARCRARSSAVGTIFASRACSDRWREGVWRAETADRRSGCVKRSRSPSSSTMRPASASARAESAPRRTADSTRDTVGSANAATARATSSAAALRRAMRSMQELVEVGWNRKLLPGCKRAASALKRGCKLEREEGIAPRGLPQPDQRRPRKRRVEPGA